METWVKKLKCRRCSEHKYINIEGKENWFPKRKEKGMVYFDHVNEKYKILRAIPHCNSWDSMYHIITHKVLQSTTIDCSLQSFGKPMKIRVHKILRLTYEFAHLLAEGRK